MLMQDLQSVALRVIAGDCRLLVPVIATVSARTVVTAVMTNSSSARVRS